MVESANRRQFIQLGASSLVLGFPFLSKASTGEGLELSPQPRVVYPGLLGLATKRMAIECKPCVVFLVRPDHYGHQLSASLATLLYDTSPEAKRLFGQAIFVCVPVAEAKAVFTPRDDAIAVLLDSTGRPLDELRINPWPLEHASRELTRFVHGPSRKHLVQFRDAQQVALGENACAQVDSAMRCLSSDTFRERESATRKLLEFTPRASAILAEAHHRGDEETRYRIDLVFDRYYSSLPETSGQRMPFGVEWFDQPHDPCPGCGRVRFDPQMHGVVKALRWTQK